MSKNLGPDTKGLLSSLSDVPRLLSILDNRFDFLIDEAVLGLKYEAAVEVAYSSFREQIKTKACGPTIRPPWALPARFPPFSARKGIAEFFSALPAAELESEFVWRKETSATTSKALVVYYDGPSYFNLVFNALRKASYLSCIQLDNQSPVFALTLIGSREYRPTLRASPSGIMLRHPADERDADHIRSLITLICQTRPQIVAAKPTIFEALIKFGSDVLSDLQSSGVKLVVSSGSDLSVELRDALAKSFGCQVTNLYASSECGYIGSECQHGRLHIDTSDKAITAHGAAPANPLYFSSYANSFLPLDTYQTNDRGKIGQSICWCGKEGLILEELCGKRFSCISFGNNTLLDPSRIRRICYDQDEVLDCVYRKTHELHLLVSIRTKNVISNQDQKALSHQLSLVMPVGIECSVEFSL